MPNAWADAVLEHALQVVGDEAIPDGDQTRYQELAERMQKGFVRLTGSRNAREVRTILREFNNSIPICLFFLKVRLPRAGDLRLAAILGLVALGGGVLK